jgi:hypothetical protein
VCDACILKTHRDILDLQLDLPERLLLVVVKVCEGKLDDTALEGVVGVL